MEGRGVLIRGVQLPASATIQHHQVTVTISLGKEIETLCWQENWSVPSRGVGSPKTLIAGWDYWGRKTIYAVIRFIIFQASIPHSKLKYQSALPAFSRKG